MAKATRKRSSAAKKRVVNDGAASSEDNDTGATNRSQDEGWARSLGNSGVQHDTDADSNSTASDIRYDRDVNEPRAKVRGGR